MPYIMKTLYTFLVFAIPFFFSAQSKWTEKPFQRKAFIENKGQFNSVLPASKRDFLYCIDRDGYQIFFYKNRLEYLFTKYSRKQENFDKKKKELANASKREREEEEKEEMKLKKETQTVSVQWLNSNDDDELLASNSVSTIFSYLLRDSETKVHTEMCQGYEKLIYKNLYDNVDVEYFFHPLEGFKYNVIAKENADLSKIQLKYKGQNFIEIKNNNIEIATIFGTIKEHAPVSYYTNEPSNPIASAYNLNNNIVSFNLDTTLIKV